MFFTVLACGSNGGIFSTFEKTRTFVGESSMPFGAFSEVLTFPVILIEECSFKLESFSLISSGQSPFFATI